MLIGADMTFYKIILTCTALMAIACSPASVPDVTGSVPTTSSTSTPSATTKNETSMTKASPPIRTVTSPHSFSDTVARLAAAIEKRPLNLFAKIDHAAGAAKAELKLAPSTLFIFGNPKGGTPLMTRNPQMGIVLPLKMHVYQDGDDVMISYTDIAAAAQSHGLDSAKLPIPNIVKMLSGLAAEVTQG